MSDLNDGDIELQMDFLTEAKELLANTERCFLSLEKADSDPEVLGQLFRLAHNLKGSSGAVGFSDLANFTHKLESLMLELKEKRLAVTPSIVDLLLRCNDYLNETIDLLRSDLKANYINQALLDEVTSALENKDQATPVTQVTPETHVTPAVQTAPATQITPSASPKASDQRHEAPLNIVPPSKPASAPTQDDNIRVSLSRIEKLLNNVGELSILQAVMVQQSIESGSNISPLMRETMSSMSKIIKETQSITMGLRMLPIKQTFHKMERIVRDTSKSLGKDVRLHLSGEETEIDKTVLERISDPLVHIVRNAVDHGLESGEERVSLGKPSQGNVYLSAYHRAGHVVIEVRDDGKGLNADHLVAKAKAKGLLSEDAVLSPQEAYQLIFAPGFSTKEVVTDVSGRGVGMDVVKTNIKALQGNIEIETQLGEGTCFRIFLPLTLAIIDSVIIRIGEERYVVPLAQVSEFFRPQPSDVNYVYGRNEIITIREKTLPAYRLANLLSRHTSEQKAASDLTALIVDDTSGRNYAVLVDQVVSQQQVVIKPLGAEVRGRKGIMGSAILGDGKPSLILDLFELTKKHQRESA